MQFMGITLNKLLRKLNELAKILIEGKKPEQVQETKQSIYRISLY